LFLPTLEDAIERWRCTRRRWLRRSGPGTLDEFQAANSLLFAIFLKGNAAEPWAEKAFQALRQALVASEPDKPSAKDGIWQSS
jgi:hypothetical protein